MRRSDHCRPAYPTLGALLCCLCGDCQVPGYYPARARRSMVQPDRHCDPICESFLGLEAPEVLALLGDA